MLRMACTVKETTSTETKTEVLKFYWQKRNKYKKQMILLSVLVAETSALRTAELAVSDVKKAIPAGGNQGIPGSKL